jgi:L-fuculose-phosphate aldolase
MPRIKRRFKQELALWTKQFRSDELTTGKDAGDLSIRDPETNLIYICPQPGKRLKIPDWGVIRPRHIVVIDMDGRNVENNGLKPTIECLMHLGIYRARPDINAVVHTHAVWSTVFAVARMEIPVAIAEFHFVNGAVGCTEYFDMGSKELADAVVKTMGPQCKAALMANHGAVTAGKDMTEAYNLAKYLEKAAKVTVFARLLGADMSHLPDIPL